MSRVGKKSITLPDKVTVKVNGSSVQVEGPKGKLSWTLRKASPPPLKAISFPLTALAKAASFAPCTARTVPC